MFLNYTHALIIVMQFLLLVIPRNLPLPDGDVEKVVAERDEMNSGEFVNNGNDRQ